MRLGTGLRTDLDPSTPQTELASCRPRASRSAHPLLNLDVVGTVYTASWPTTATSLDSPSCPAKLYQVNRLYEKNVVFLTIWLLSWAI